MKLKDYQQFDPSFKEYVLTRLSTLTDEEIVKYLPEATIKQFMENWEEFWRKEKQLNTQTKEGEQQGKTDKIQWEQFERKNNKTKPKSKLRISLESLALNEFLKIGKSGLNKGSMHFMIYTVKKEQNKDFKTKRQKDDSGWVIVRTK